MNAVHTSSSRTHKAYPNAANHRYYLDKLADSTDAFGLCLKAGSAVILRGGKEAFKTNHAVVNAIRSALAAEGLPEDAVQMVPDTSRETANEMMRLNGYLDVLIPRGGAGLINSVVQNSTVPVIQTGVGNCHVYGKQYSIYLYQSGLY